MSFWKHVTDIFRNYRSTVAAGRYSGNLHVPDDLGASFAQAASADERAGFLSLNAALIIGSNTAFAAAALVFSLPILAAVTIAVAGTGLGLYGLEYLHAKRAAEKHISETNVAGQHVSGRRGDLYRLHVAQMKIIDLSVEFGQAAGAPLRRTLAGQIEKIENSVAPEAARVRVLDEGRHHAGMKYSFVQPALHLLKPPKGAKQLPLPS